TSTIMNKLAHLATRGQIPQRNMHLFSYMHSGVDVLNAGRQDINALLPEHNPDYQIPEAMTYFALGHKILTKGSELHEQTKKRSYPILERMGVHWSGHTIHDVSKEDKERLTSEQLAEMSQPKDYLRQALDPHMRDWQQPRLSDTQIKTFLEAIEQIKSNRTDDPHGPYISSLAEGRDNLSNQVMNKHTALYLYEKQMRARGDFDFPDYLHYASKALEEQGIEAVPENMQGLQVVVGDEAQDNMKIGVRLLSNLLKATSHNKPRMIMGYDPMQTLIAPKFGGIEQNEIEQVHEQEIGPFELHELSLNRRSNQSTVSIMNQVLDHPELIHQNKSPKQEAMRPEMGHFPRIRKGEHPIDVYAQMFDAMLQENGISHKQMRENILQDEHPFANIPFQKKNAQGKWEGVGSLPPRRTAAIFSQWRDRDAFVLRQQQRLQQQLGITPEQAERAAKQIFRDRPPGPNASQVEKDEANLQYATSLHSRFRSLSASHIHQDVTRVGGGNDQEALNRFFIGISRADEIGKNSIYYTERPFTYETFERWKAEPESLRRTPGGNYTIGNEEPTPIHLDARRNRPDMVGSREVPHGLGPVFRGHIDDMLRKGTSPYSPYFEEQDQPYALQRAVSLGIMPKEALAPHLPEMLGPRFWTRPDLANIRGNMQPEEQAKVAKSLAAYPDQIAQAIVGSGQNNPQTFLESEMAYQEKRQRDVIQPMAPGPERDRMAM